MRLAVFSSSQGSNFECIAKACARGQIPADCSLLFTNNKLAPVVKIAEQLKVPVEVLEYLPHEAWDIAVLNLLMNHRIDFIALCGFLKPVGPRVLAAFKNRIVNSHPSLLPQYGGPGMYGSKVHAAVLKNRETVSGITIHFVTEKYDDGPIVEACQVPVFADDTVESLQARIKKVENEFYVEVLAQLLAGQAK